MARLEIKTRKKSEPLTIKKRKYKKKKYRVDIYGCLNMLIKIIRIIRIVSKNRKASLLFLFE